MSKKVIISIDGGGVRGIIPAIIIREIEERLQERNETKQFIEYVDLFAGTSTGGILAGLYTLTDEYTNQLKFTTNDVIEIYQEFSHRIFDRPLSHKIRTLWGLLGSKYKSEKYEKILKEIMGDSLLSQTYRDILIPAQLLNVKEVVGRENTKRYGEYFFKTTKAIGDDRSNFLMRNIIRSTTSVPTYFEPAIVDNLKQEEFIFVDGGLYANNPSHCAVVEEISKGTPIKDIILVSFGTGNEIGDISKKQAKRMGVVEWGLNIIDTILDSSTGKEQYQLKQLYREHPQNYIRIESELYSADSKLDNASEENIKKLISDAYRFIQENDELIETIVNAIGQTRFV